MNPFRVMPLILIAENDCLKGERFRNHKYVGDPLNIVKIFNEKEVDEIIIIDIKARANNKINWQLLQDMADECRMPFSYAGNVNSLDDIRKLNKLGVEKVILTMSNLSDINFIKNAVSDFGSSTISFLIDIKKNFLGRYKVKYSTKDLNLPISNLIRKISDLGVGEIIIQNVSLEGTRKGMDLEIISELSIDEKLPIVLSGGLNSYEECFHLANTTNISGVAVGANFIYYGEKKAVLIDYFEKNQIIELFKLRI